VATINLNYIQHPERCYCEVIGDKAWLFVDIESGRVQQGVHIDAAVHHRSFIFERDDLFRAEHEAFIQAARGERKAESPPDVAIQSVYVVDAAIQSLRCGRPVSLKRAAVTAIQ
jgi:hypothetical protein